MTASFDAQHTGTGVTAARELREILGCALSMLEVIASKAPEGSSVRNAIYAECDAMRHAANVILKRATEG